MATPVKFQAPSLTMQAGLEVGRYTFRLLARVELAFVIATIILACVVRPPWFTVFALALVIVEVLVQRFWLLPALDNRVSQILAGAVPFFSADHAVYAVMEVIKVALLVAAAGTLHVNPALQR